MKSTSNVMNTSTTSTTNTVLKVKRTRKTVPRDSPPQRSSIYRGVTRHRWTGRYEAHLWDKNCWNESQNKKGRQVYLGAYDDEDTAAHAYDLAALKYWGPETILNFPLATYQKELVDMEGQSREEYIGSLRRFQPKFARSKKFFHHGTPLQSPLRKAVDFLGEFQNIEELPEIKEITKVPYDASNKEISFFIVLHSIKPHKHHHNGRWEARIGRVFGNKYLYLGTYATQEEAAVAYDMAAIEYRGLNAVTNFDLSRYIKWLRPNNNVTTNQLTDKVETNLTLPDPNHELGLNTYQQSQTSTVNHNITLSSQGSATSALGLLLQSSKFKEMMEMTTASEIPTTSQESEQPQSSFPKEIQTNFGYQDFGFYGDGDEFFQDLGSYIFDA